MLLPLLKEQEFFPDYWKTLLKGVVAFVDVRTGSDNRSKSIENEIEKLGATVVAHFSKKVTHLIFKDGSKPIYDKAKLLGVAMVSYLWVVACKEKGEMVGISDYPAVSSQDYDSPYFKWRKTKSMQPKELDEELKIVERRLDRRRKKMQKSMTIEEKDESKSSSFFSPSIPRSRKSIVDTLIESSPMVQERIQQEFASGKSYQEVFTLKEGEEDDFDTFFDTPLMIKFIAKNYYSPLEPPPKSVRKILSEIRTPKTGVLSNRNSSSPSTSVGNVSWNTSNVIMEEPDSPINELLTGRKRATPFPAISEVKRRKEEVEDVENQPQKKKLFQSKCDAEVGISPTSQLAMTDKKRAKRRSTTLDVKKRKEEIDRADKVPKRKHLFQPKCNPLFPEELVALTPETPAKTKDHPCYSQTEVKRPKAVMKAGSQSSRKHTIEQMNEVDKQTSDEEICSQMSPELIVRRIGPQRDSLATDFAFSVIRRRSTVDFKELRPAKHIPSLVCTSIHSECSALVKEAVGLLKCFKIVETVDDSTTHVVCGDSRRTFNVMKGIVYGAKLVNLQWVRDSIREGCWQNEDGYPVERFSDCSRRMEGDLLADFNIYISPKSAIPFRDLSDLVKRTGGNLTNASKKANLVVGVWKEDVPCVKGTWILDCIEKGRILTYDDYLIPS